MMEALEPWKQLYQVIVVLSPVFVFSFLFSVIVYVLFALILPWMGSRAIVSARASGESGAGPHPDTTIIGVGDAEAQFGYAGSFGYVLVASLFGVVLGMLVKLVGGFTALAANAPSNAVVGAIGSILVIVLGVIGTLFADNGKVLLRRPVGAIAFLVSFLVSGFYWQFLRGAVPN